MMETDKEDVHASRQSSLRGADKLAVSLRTLPCVLVGLSRSYV